MNRVDHIPQTLASHSRLPEDVQPQGLEGGSSAVHHGADMLKPDPRDTFFNSKSTVIISLIFPSVIIAQYLSALDLSPYLTLSLFAQLP